MTDTKIDNATKVFFHDFIVRFAVLGFHQN